MARASKMLAEIEQEQAKRDTAGRVVIFDPATGLPLPGFAPNPNAEQNIWVPDNGRDNYAGTES